MQGTGVSESPYAPENWKEFVTAAGNAGCVRVDA